MFYEIPSVVQDGRTPLHHAAFHGNPEACKSLIEAGCEIDAQDSVSHIKLNLHESVSHIKLNLHESESHIKLDLHESVSQIKLE